MKRLLNWLRSRNLRNKPGGWAMINGNADEGAGTEALVNRVVQTVKVANGDFWVIAPAQRYECTRHSFNLASKNAHSPGDVVTAVAMRDRCLTPLADPGDDVADESRAWLPPVPTGKPEGEKLRLPVREMGGA